MRYCKKCVMPDTKPDLSFDVEGVCDACQSAALKNTIDWKAREAEFKELVEKFKNKDDSKYDCIIPVSGGKDSTYQAYLIRQWGLNPLLVHFEPTVRTELGRKNLENIRQFGDMIELKKNPEVYKKMIMEGFRRVGGGPRAGRMKNTLDRRWLEEFGGLLGLRVDDMVGVDGIKKEDLVPYRYPSDTELKEAGITGVFLGYYFKWDARPQVELVRTRGFSVKEDGPVECTYLNYENLDEATYAVHDLLKFVKFGFSRATDHACLDIRNGRISREEGVKLVEQYDGKRPRKAIAEFLKYSGISEAEFDKVVDSFTDKALFETDGQGNLKRDGMGDLIKKYRDYA